MIGLLLALLLPICTPNAQGIPVCPRETPDRQTISAPAEIVAAMQDGTACGLGVDIYSTATGEAWYSWRENNPGARMVERVRSADASIPDSWLFYANGQWVVFVFERKLSSVQGGGVIVVHGQCARLIDG
jgi:hypothetical protein